VPSRNAASTPRHALLRRAVAVALVSGDDPAAHRLSEAIGRVSEGAADAASGRVAPGGRAAGTRMRRTWLAAGFRRRRSCAGAHRALPGAARPGSFVLLLGAAIVLMTSRLVPNFATGLGLIAGWVLLGIAKPAQVLGGFASKEWRRGEGAVAGCCPLAKPGMGRSWSRYWPRSARSPRFRAVMRSFICSARRDSRDRLLGAAAGRRRAGVLVAWQ
jgi:hypothetical protein